MQVKCFEIRDFGTFLPVICIRPVPENGAQAWLLRRDGYRCEPDETLIIMINAQCKGAAYDPYDWGERTKRTAHHYIEQHWAELKDGDVIDVEYILGETQTPKISERLSPYEALPKGVVAVPLDDPAKLHNTIAAAIGEPSKLRDE